MVLFKQLFKILKIHLFTLVYDRSRTSGIFSDKTHHFAMFISYYDDTFKIWIVHDLSFKIVISLL